VKLDAIVRRAGAAIRGRSADVVLKTDGGGWILDQFSHELQAQLRDRLSVYVSSVPVAGLRGRIVHYIGSECFYDPAWQHRRPHASNVTIGTWWHGTAATPDPSVRDAVARIAGVSRLLSKVHVTCAITRDIVRGLGVDDAKIAFVPMGVDTRRYAPVAGLEERSRVRRALDLPDDAVVIGSFQKDGVGWGEGLEPKMIKGPDIFVQVLSRLAKRLKVIALIPGPSRGYLARELRAAGVPFRSDGFVPPTTFPPYYHACDVYLMTGREEGGPASVLESLASGTPLVGHRVGLAPDVIRQGVDGFLADVGDVDALTDGVERLAASASLRADFAREGRATAERYDWIQIAPLYEQLYAAVRPPA
jgi:glycosyltransferase involved in cell wall biosynthesis